MTGGIGPSSRMPVSGKATPHAAGQWQLLVGPSPWWSWPAQQSSATPDMPRDTWAGACAMDEIMVAGCPSPTIPADAPCTGAIAMISHANQAISRRRGVRAEWRSGRFIGAA